MVEPPPLRVLLADDDPVVVRLVSGILAARGLGAVTTVGTAREALARAGEADVVLLDHQLPDAAGIDLIAGLAALPSRPSVVIITAHGSEALAAQALRSGADDYLVKDPKLAELLPQVIERVRRERALRHALAAAEQELVRTERLRAIGEMNVTLHHEINNPLMSASAEVELLLADPTLAPPQRHGLEAVRVALGRIRDILVRARELRRAESTEYVAGTTMIDLGAAGRDRGPQRGTAALWIDDEPLARVTSHLLGLTGFSVRRASDRLALEREAQTLGVTLLVVQAAAGPGPADPLGGFRPHADRLYRLIALVPPALADAPLPADLVLALPFDPVAFRRDVEALVPA